MDYQGIGMIIAFLILVTLFVTSITSKTSGYKYKTPYGKKYYKSGGKKYYESGVSKMRIK